MAETKRFISSE